MKKKGLLAGALLGALILAGAALWLLRSPAPAGDPTLPVAAADASGVLRYTGFSLKYNERYEQAEWVAYQLTAEEARGGYERSEDFRADANVLTGSAALDDYRGSGFDRGHLAPAGDMGWSARAMSESFLMSNMSPQDPGFNRGVWRRLEEQVREWAEENGELYVVTGPVLTDGPFEAIGGNAVAVPRRFYKVLLDYREPELKAIGFLLPNRASSLPLSAFVFSVDEVEAATALDFFAALPDRLEDQLEARAEPELWGLAVREGAP